MNSKDFTNSAPYDNSFNKESQDGRAVARPSDFTTQPLNSMVPFPQQPFSGNFMNMPPQNGMFYMPYPNQYMNYVKLLRIMFLNFLGLQLYVFTLQGRQKLL